MTPQQGSRSMSSSRYSVVLPAAQVTAYRESSVGRILCEGHGERHEVEAGIGAGQYMGAITIYGCDRIFENHHVRNVTVTDVVNGAILNVVLDKEHVAIS